MKMSDALRGAAETAPVETVHVSVGAVRTRAKRNRALRTGANGLVGVGAAALVFAGVMSVIGSQTGLAAAEGAGNGKDAVVNGGATNPNVGTADVAPRPDSTNSCGATFDASAFDVDPATATITVNAVNDDALDISLNTTGAVAAEYTTGQPLFYVLWNGIYVGGPQVVTDEAWTWNSVAGETTSAAYTPALVNCWDGAALPAGDYTIVSAQNISSAAVAPPVSESPSPSTSASPAAPDTAVSSDAVVAGGTTTTIVSSPASFTIAGDAASDPFEKYLKAVDPTPQPTTPAAPSDALTTEAARAAYEAALTKAGWDMAAGTHRVVMTSSADDPNGDMWATSYYGCPTDGANADFPAKSADLNWLQVNASLPASVHLSYGWVVDGNPLVNYSVKNVTDSSLPGFYAGSAPRLVLVKDGRVVAEAYPVNPDQSNGGIAYANDGGVASGGASGSSATRDSLILAPAGDGYLAPGASVSGDYLWRDVNGCWTTNGQANVAAGTYTVLTEQDLYIGQQYAVMESDVPPSAADTSGKAAESTSSAGGPAVDVAPAIAPNPTPGPDGNGDYVSFQVWTSLGTVTVTN